jgi:hypothetical protein
VISEWFIGLALTIQEWFLGLFGDDPVPTWITEPATFLAEISARVSGLGAWFPFPLLFTMIGTLLAAWLGFWLVKGIRWLWGLTPFSGGS